MGVLCWTVCCAGMSHQSMTVWHGMVTSMGGKVPGKVPVQRLPTKP